MSEPLLREFARKCTTHLCCRIPSVQLQVSRRFQFFQVGLILQLKESYGVQIIGLETGPNALPLWEVDVRERCGIIVGEERTGLSSATLQLCDVIAEIPMSPSVPSVNVGVASAVGLYDLILRNRFNSR